MNGVLLSAPASLSLIGAFFIKVFLMRRKTKPDTRPDWRDPNMPVMRDYTFASGKHMTIVEPDFESGFRGYMMSHSVQPDWRQDPTYNLRKSRR